MSKCVNLNYDKRIFLSALHSLNVGSFMIIEIFRSTSSLFFGMTLLMLGNGLQGTLVGWRANYEGFSSSTTGLIMTAFYIGVLCASFTTTKLVHQVGHVRVFAALASLASAAVLAQALIIDPLTWAVMRFITGFCFAGIFVIVESWLNERSDNQSRGMVLSIYLFISLGGLAGGQWLFNLGDPTGLSLFILGSILLSMALVPVLLTPSDAPEIKEYESMNPLKLFYLAPAGVASILLSSVAVGVMIGMGPVYAAAEGMSIARIASFMSVFLAFGAIAHIPLGWLSDRIDRRLVILGATFSAALLSIVLLQIDVKTTLFIVVFGLLGAMVMPIYSLGGAHTNDRLRPEQMANAGGTIVLLYGVGAAIGPITMGYIIKVFGNVSFIYYLGLINLLTGLLVLYWIFQREAVPDEQQIDFQLAPSQSTVLTMDAIAYEAEELISADEELDVDSVVSEKIDSENIE